MKTAIVLLSGGLDSTTCLAHAKALGFECVALSFDYGQRHTAELVAARRVAESFRVQAHRIVSLDVNTFLGSSLTDKQLEVPQQVDAHEIPTTYVPARNMIFLSMALAHAEMLGAHDIFIGVSAVDYSNYPDCRPEFIEAFQKVATLATKAGVSGHPMKIHAPLMTLSKAQTIRLGLKYGVDYALTVSCYQATIEGLACGVCPSCQLRRQGFVDAGVPDSTRYIHR